MGTAEEMSPRSQKLRAMLYTGLVVFIVNTDQFVFDITGVEASIQDIWFSLVVVGFALYLYFKLASPYMPEKEDRSLFSLELRILLVSFILSPFLYTLPIQLLKPPTIYVYILGLFLAPLAVIPAFLLAPIDEWKTQEKENGAQKENESEGFEEMSSSEIVKESEEWLDEN